MRAAGGLREHVVVSGESCRWYAGSEVRGELSGARGAVFASVEWDCVGAPFLTGAFLESDSDGLHVVIVRGAGKRVVRIRLPKSAGSAAGATLWVGEGPTVWLTSRARDETFLWCARLAATGKEWRQAACSVSDDLRVLGVEEGGRLLVAAQEGALAALPSSSVLFPLARYEVASRLSVEDVLRVAQHAAAPGSWKFRLLQLEDATESVSVSDWPILPNQPFYAAVASRVTRIAPGLVAIGTALGLVLGVAGENTLLFCVQCADGEAISQIETSAQHILVTSVRGDSVTLLSLEGQVVRRIALQDGCAATLSDQEVLICRGLDVVQRFPLHGDGVAASQTSGKVLYALRQRQVEGAEEMAQSEERIQQKRQLYDTVTAAFAVPGSKLLAVESVAQAFEDDGAWIVTFRIRALETIEVGRVILYGFQDAGAVCHSLSGNVERQAAQSVFERSVAVYHVALERLTAVGVAIETSNGEAIVLGQLRCEQLDQQRLQFRSSAFRPMHGSAKTDAVLQVTATGATRLLSCLGATLKQWSEGGLRSAIVESEPSDQEARIRVSVFGASGLKAAVRALAAALPPDVRLRSVDDGARSGVARRALTREIELELSNEASRARLVLVAQVETDEAMCELLEHQCAECES